MTLLYAFLDLTLLRVEVILAHILLEERPIVLPCGFLPRVYLLYHRFVNSEPLVVTESQVGHTRD